VKKPLVYAGVALVVAGLIAGSGLTYALTQSYTTRQVDIRVVRTVSIPAGTGCTTIYPDGTPCVIDSIPMAQPPLDTGDLGRGIVYRVAAGPWSLNELCVSRPTAAYSCFWLRWWNGQVQLVLDPCYAYPAWFPSAADCQQAAAQNPPVTIRYSAVPYNGP
jgi:hypothetical protein